MEMDATTFRMVIICLVICVFCTYRSYRNTKKNIVDGGAQIVVTVGVFFTFVGIAVGLYNFNTNPETMGEQLDIFLGGMKTAFFTSIIGMFFGVAIKILQSKVEQSDDEFIKKNLAAMDLTNLAVRNNTDTISRLLQDIKAGLDASNNEQLQRELPNLILAMKSFIYSSENSRADMKNLSQSMREQAAMIEKLSLTLTENINAFGKNQEKQLSALSDKIVESDIQQTQRLDTMNETIEKMQSHMALSQKNSEDLLNETKNYQRQSLENDKEQAQILSDNTQRITEMKESFDKFLKDMAENYSNELIHALNISMDKLNTQLQTQFGENFKELNAAVREVVVWQRDYKEIVEKTTEELLHIDKVFREFADTLSGELEYTVESLAENLKTFANTSEKNISIQQNLNESTAKLKDMVEQSRQSILEMQKITKSFGKFSEKALKENLAVLQNHADQLAKFEENFGTEIKKLNDTALTVTTDTTHYLRDFNTVSNDVMKEIRQALEAFKNDFEEESKKSVSGLNQLFETLAKKTDKQSEKAIKTLAGSLSEISMQMIGNYNALINKITELDEFIAENRSRK